jgi:L-ascorbate metabolism protein UlaG (beta-lactamase superfamily)
MLENIFWLGHSTVRIDTEPVIYIDPWKLKKPKRAGIVLIIHYGDIVGSLADARKFKEYCNVAVEIKPVTD